MVPIAVFNRVMELNNGHHACREIWPDHLWESMYQVVLDAVLLVIPLFLMCFSYGRVARELWSDVSIGTGEPGSPLSESDPQRYEVKDRGQNGYTTPITQSPLLPRRHVTHSVSCESTSANGKHQLNVLRPAYNSRVLANKKRVVKMLCVVVLEYFVCWTPLFLLNTWSIIDYRSARDHFTPLLKSSFLLLSYLSSCIHPITYCFMNKRFRQSFADAFRCCFRRRALSRDLYSEASHVNTAGSDRPDTRARKHYTITWKRDR
ncbi:cholecystokinin receptor type A [Aplysia californica]|uniref:Cholecystokinin receptor type A n=1 Tax=Aplysia californica TaxID=6500 RepID=A0ABM1AF30_APLCA|nr:cholecystokinin receptor type A [Aplysia californica]